MNAIAVIFALCFARVFAGLLERGQTLPDQNITKECLKEYRIDLEKTGDAALTDEEIYCVPACAYRDYGIMRPDGTINPEKAESYFGAEDGEERTIFFSVYEACRRGNTHCKLVQCMFGQLKNHWESSSESGKVTRQLFSRLA